MKHLIVFTFLIFSLSPLFSQKIEKELYLKHAIKQENQSFQFTVLDNDKFGVLFYDKSKFYYWFKAQTVLATQGASSGQLLHGNFESFYTSKQLSQKGAFRKGLKNGQWLYWREDGTLIRFETWKCGSKRGKETHYDKNGKEVYTINFKRRKYIKQSADSLIVSNFDNSKQKITVFDKNGKVLSKTKYKNSQEVTKGSKIEDASADTTSSSTVKSSQPAQQETSSKVNTKKRTKNPEIANPTNTNDQVNQNQQNSETAKKSIFSKFKRKAKANSAPTEPNNQEPKKKLNWKFWKKTKSE